MRIIFNNILPFKGFTAMAIYPFILIRSEFKSYQHSERWNSLILHERIHFEQQKELLLVFFYLWYGIEFIIRLVIHRNTYLAYKNISFEKEAYQNDKKISYLSTRKRFNWLKHL
ncbi:hypothetical protein [Flammeovirga kamogawensis]|uniref:Peptidase M56 domain-containing protein n=1 Tax=Flammeovirga kamogawensis TaxID=373891 RepID=A0ABX8GTT1_9BACT|nr:hypothetical protein [Flammeovirga kamogawensis]MBB6462432.1 hypothetical protein [Flammeovirga kamogawensis]QWG06829.1 hypothetical protein KM029_16190 [Flammeovirga kamogawensis]TRX68653.1 hypothetical protein EO216_11185 [Flammeovirga kamogawensis]